MKKRSKKYRQIAEKVDKGKLYSVEEALDFLLKHNPAKFDATVELHLNLNLQRGKEKIPFRILVLPPYPLSRPPKIAVLAEKFSLKDKNVLADQSKILKQIKNGKVDFEILVATKEMLPKITPYAKFLGPKGLMPTEKNQTLTDKPEEVVKNLLKGQREIRADEFGIVHLPCGKISLGKEKILKNIRYLIEEIKRNRPEGIKGEFIKSAYLTSTMAPSLKIDLATL